MSKDTPTAHVTAKALKEVKVKDASGRAITLRAPGVLAQYRLIEALGDVAKNETYTNMALPLIFVVDIDGEPVTFPTNKLLIEALITRLSDEGVAAVMEGVKTNFGEQNPEADKQAIKK